jgi:kinesin family protein 2/24
MASATIADSGCDKKGNGTGGIVCEWLQRIGLGYAVDNFRTRGIDTPQALIGLTFQDYDTLQITVLADRKRLFELVQRVRMAARAVKRNGEGSLHDGTSKTPYTVSNRVNKKLPGVNLSVETGKLSAAAKSSRCSLDIDKYVKRDTVVQVSSKRDENVGEGIVQEFAIHEKYNKKDNCCSVQDIVPKHNRNNSCKLPLRPNTAGVKIGLDPSATLSRKKRQVHHSLDSAIDGTYYEEKDEIALTKKLVGRKSETQMMSNVSAVKPRVPLQRKMNSSTTQPTGQKNFDTNIDLASKIRVVVRKRPMSRKEKSRGDVDVIEIKNRELILHEPRVKVDMTRYVESHSFAFDETFDDKSGNEDIYERTCKPLVEAVLNGAKATCFAYGQTGSGKTFTMMGPDADGRHRPKRIPGLYELAVKDMFEKIRSPEFRQYQVCVSFFEIYGGKLFDLLNERRKLRCLEDGKKHANIVGLRKVTIVQVEDLFKLMKRGHDARSTGTTGANLDSSRSHAVLQIVLKDSITGRGRGKISFIDLAGSERGQDTTHADRQTRMEGAEINKSLLALKECIRALYHEQDHTPFRGSKLTQVLKDSFTGNGRTVMVVTISPNMGNCEHTLNTLRYGYRVKEIGKDSNHSRRANGSLDLNRDFGVRKSNISSDVSGSKIRQRLLLRAYPNRTEKETAPTTIVGGNRSESRTNMDNLAHRRSLTRGRPKKNGRTYSEATESSSVSNLDALSAKECGFTEEEGGDNKSIISKHFSALTSSAASNLKPTSVEQQDTGEVASGSLIIDSFSQEKRKLQQKLKIVNASDIQISAAECTNDKQIDKVENVPRQDLSQEHQELVSTILSEEEDLVASHREHIHSMMNLVKEEMSILNRVDMPGAKIDKYADELEVVLNRKLKQVVVLKQRLETFKSHLKEEESLHSSMNSTSSPLH